MTNEREFPPTSALFILHLATCDLSEALAHRLPSRIGIVPHTRNRQHMTDSPRKAFVAPNTRPVLPPVRSSKDQHSTASTEDLMEVGDARLLNPCPIVSRSYASTTSIRRSCSRARHGFDVRLTRSNSLQEPRQTPSPITTPHTPPP